MFLGFALNSLFLWSYCGFFVWCFCYWEKYLKPKDLQGNIHVIEDPEERRNKVINKNECPDPKTRFTRWRYFSLLGLAHIFLHNGSFIWNLTKSLFLSIQTQAAEEFLFSLQSTLGCGGKKGCLKVCIMVSLWGQIEAEDAAERMKCLISG